MVKGRQSIIDHLDSVEKGELNSEGPDHLHSGVILTEDRVTGEKSLGRASAKKDGVKRNMGVWAERV